MHLAESGGPSRVTIRAAAAFGAAVLFVVYQFGVQTSYSAMQGVVRAELQISSLASALVSAAFLISYGLMQLPAGLLLDRLGPGRLLWIGVLAMGACVWLFSVANSAAVLILARVLMGVAASLAFTGAGLVARRGLPAAVFPIAMGLADCAIGLGGGLGELGTDALIENWGWRWAVAIQAATAIPVSILCVLLVSTFPVMRGGGPGAVPNESVWDSVVMVLSTREVLRAMVIYGGACGVLFGFGTLWNRPLQTAWGWSPEEAATISTAFFAGLLIGAPLNGWLGIRLGVRRVLLANMMLALITYGFDLFVPLDTPLWFDVCLVGTLGLALSASELAFTIGCDAVDHRQTAAAVGVINAAGLLGGAVLQAVPGGVIAILADDSLPSLQASQIVFLGAIAVAGLAAWRKPR